MLKTTKAHRVKTLQAIEAYHAKNFEVALANLMRKVHSRLQKLTVKTLLTTKAYRAGMLRVTETHRAKSFEVAFANLTKKVHSGL